MSEPRSHSGLLNVTFSRARARSRTGELLNSKWRLDALLGAGGTATVYAATHRNNGGHAAIKILHDDLADNDQVRERFLREGYVANAVGHDGVVKVADDGVAEDGSLFLVTELLDGETIEDRRARLGGRLEEGEVLEIASQVLAVLEAAHAKHILHRDIKPQNIFVTRAGQVKVLDFGIARLRELTTIPSSGGPDLAIGTPAYMPPEQANGSRSELDERTDLWAVGATMFTLLSGKLVRDDRTTGAQLLSAARRPVPPIAVAAPHVSPPVAHLIDRALAFRMDRRWSSAAEMRQVIEQVYQELYGKPIPPHPRLVVPNSVPNRTYGRLLSPQAAAKPNPDADTKDAASPTSGKWKLVIAAVAMWVGLIILTQAGIAVFAATRRDRDPVPDQRARDAAIETEIDPQPEPDPIPVISATDLPITPPAPPTPTEPRAPTAVSRSRTNCSPPYEIDSRGYRNWKVNCL